MRFPLHRLLVVSLLLLIALCSSLARAQKLRNSQNKKNDVSAATAAAAQASTRRIQANVTTTSTNTQQQQRLDPARVSCNALYSTACARTNAQFLATTTAQTLTERLQSATSPQEVSQIWDNVNQGNYNLEAGFYPFVVDINTSKCIADGSNKVTSHVGLTLQEVLQQQGNGFSDADALLERFQLAAEQEGAWVQYLWQDSGRTHTKLAYVVPVYYSFSEPQQYHILGVGYSTVPLPPDLPCSAKQDGFCSITNTLSLVGKAQLKLSQSKSQAQFESVMYELSFNKEEYQIDDGFFIFMYHYDGRLKAHGLIHNHFDGYSWDIAVALGVGTLEQGKALHQKSIEAAEGPGWLQYEWRLSPSHPDTFTKISYVAKVEFAGEKYLLGVGYKFERPISSGDEECSPDYNLPCSFRTALSLSSHVVSHAISSNLPIDDVWKAVSNDEKFRQGGFYTFVFNEDGACVSHIVPDFIGRTTADIVASANMDLDNPPSTEALFNAARTGAGWYLYEWGVPGGEPNGDDFIYEKIAYVFKINLNGKDYVGGVGFNNQRANVSLFIDPEEGTRRNGEPIPCSQNYSLPCSDINTEAILGQAMADLTLASSEGSTGELAVEDDVQDLQLYRVLDSITGRNSAYRVNNFYVAVFSFDGEGCTLDDGSGCCIAHGEDPNLVGKTWQQILDGYQITSIQGDDLHNYLIFASNNIGARWDFPWSRESGEAQTVRTLTSRYRHKQKRFYIITDYFKSRLPPTCDDCPSDLHCTSDYQSFCESIPDQVDGPLEWIIALSALVGASIILFYWVRQRNRAKRRILDRKIKAMEDEIHGVVEICQDTGAQISTAQKYCDMFGMLGDMGRDTARSKALVFWYWREDPSLLHNHDSTLILPGTTFVKYPDKISRQLEDAYQLLLKGDGYYEITLDLAEVANKFHNQQTGLKFSVDFEEMVQVNPVTDHRRDIRREEVPIQLDEELASNLPPLPGDVDFFGPDGEDYLPTFKGQVIQVSKEHPTLPWIYGSVLYDPLLDTAQDQPQAAAGLYQILSNALHDRPSSGWFPKVLSKAADVKVMQSLLVTLGGEGVKNLKAPDTWDDIKEGIIPVVEGTEEYNQVVHYFLAALYEERDNVEVIGVERVQSMPLWQSYAVKKQTMKTRDGRNPGNLVNNRDLNCLERKWLFHGTRPDTIAQIVKQGFNRAFAGRNAVLYGRGVYFARDASYSSHHAYSRPDQGGVQRMFMCRVAVGDWCQGAEGMLTPAPKPNNNLELFDSTVDDVANPSVFVVYHDSQAYPDYLVSFKRND